MLFKPPISGVVPSHSLIPHETSGIDVIPANAGIHTVIEAQFMDSRVRDCRKTNLRKFSTFF